MTAIEKAIIGGLAAGLAGVALVFVGVAWYCDSHSSNAWFVVIPAILCFVVSYWFSKSR